MIVVLTGSAVVTFNNDPNNSGWLGGAGVPYKKLRSDSLNKISEASDNLPLAKDGMLTRNSGPSWRSSLWRFPHFIENV